MLEALASASADLGVRDIARLVGVAPSTAQRLLATLSERGFAEQGPSRKYRVGLRAFVVGHAFLSGNALARESLTELQVLADRHQLNGFLGMRRGARVIYLLAVQSSGPVVIRGAPGAHTYLHTTALGKVLLAEMPDSDIRQLLGPEPYERLTAKTRVRLGSLLQDLRKVRINGYAVSDEENLMGVYAVGAAVRDATGAAIAAISAALPRHEVNKPRHDEISHLIREVAQRISARLGSPGAAC